VSSCIHKCDPLRFGFGSSSFALFLVHCNLSRRVRLCHVDRLTASQIEKRVTVLSHMTLHKLEEKRSNAALVRSKKTLLQHESLDPRHLTQQLSDGVAGVHAKTSVLSMS